MVFGWTRKKIRMRAKRKSRLRKIRFEVM